MRIVVASLDSRLGRHSAVCLIVLEGKRFCYRPYFGTCLGLVALAFGSWWNFSCWPSFWLWPADQWEPGLDRLCGSWWYQDMLSKACRPSSWCPSGWCASREWRIIPWTSFWKCHTGLDCVIPSQTLPGGSALTASGKQIAGWFSVGLDLGTRRRAIREYLQGKCHQRRCCQDGGYPGILDGNFWQMRRYLILVVLAGLHCPTEHILSIESAGLAVEHSFMRRIDFCLAHREVSWSCSFKSTLNLW